MPAHRPDLLALSPDDLAALANRGLLKRAQKEADQPDLSAQWTESDDNTIVAVWSDSITCTLPGAKTLKDATCTCSAHEMCRHILRTVLAWQKKRVSEREAAKAAPPAPAPASTAPADAPSGEAELKTDKSDGPAPDAAAGVATPDPSAATGTPDSQPKSWDPGSIPDPLIETQVPKSVRERAELLWKQGVLAELLRSAKPSAHFYCPGHTVRFLVPDDVRYAQCSCSDPSPCVHAVLAVRTFRCLPANARSGIISEGPLAKPVPPEPLIAAESCVAQLLTDGFESLQPAWRDRVRRTAADCNSAGLTWPAQIMEELADNFDRYTARDAGFSPEAALQRAGELLLRKDAIFAGGTTNASDSATANLPVPQAFVRGMKSDRDSDLGPSRFIGLGAMVSQGRLTSTVTVFMQDCDTGHPMTLEREFNEVPTDEQPHPRRSFQQLGQATAVKDANLRKLAAGQLITNGGRRTAAGRVIVGRARAVVNPQNFSWEMLKAPVLVEDFAELVARLRLLPPASFRPRRAASDFHVCPLSAVEAAEFSPQGNSIEAIVRDRSGNLARMSHPWSERGQVGAEALLAAIKAAARTASLEAASAAMDDPLSAAPSPSNASSAHIQGIRPLYVAGNVRAHGPQLVIYPSAIIFTDGNSRWAVLPWLEASPLPTFLQAAGNGSNGHSPALRKHTEAAEEKPRYHAAATLLTEVILNGLRRTKSHLWPDWHQTAAEFEESGYHRIAGMLESIRAGSGDATATTMQVLKLITLARDVEHSSQSADADEAGQPAEEDIEVSPDAPDDEEDE